MKKSSSLSQINSYLQKFNLIDHLNNDLISHCEIHMFNKGEKIYTLEEEIFYMYFLVKGKTKVSTLLSNGKSLLLCFSTPLEVMGDIELIDNPLADCNVVALEPCTCLAFPLKEVKKYGYNDPLFLRFIITSLGKKLRNNSIYSSINMLYPLENRFASYILSSYENNLNKNYSVEIESLTHISELLGTSYRHLNRIVHCLSSKNIIRKEKNSLIILNYEYLKSLTQDIFLQNN